MENIFLGNLIRKRREALNIRQDTLCSGICNTMTLSRLENGQQLPARHKIVAIMDRLGLPSDRYYVILSKNDEDISILQSEINSLVVQAEHEASSVIYSKIEQAYIKIKALKEITDNNDTVIKQFIMSKEMTLKKLEAKISLDEQLNTAIQTLQITAPTFNPNGFTATLLSLDEITLLNQIAAIYAKKNEHIKAIQIYAQVFVYIQKHLKEVDKAKSKQALIAHNYARELDLTANYSKAITIADIGIHTCTQYEHYQFLPGLFHIQAECWYYLGNIQKCHDFFYQAYYLYKTMKNTNDINLLIKDAEIWFNKI